MDKEEALRLIELLREFVNSTDQSWHKKGYDFERRFSGMCAARGLDCRKAGRGHFDFRVNGARVQCKCLVPDCNGVVLVQPGSGSAYTPGSFDVLAVETPRGLHIVPECHIPRTKNSGLLKAAIAVSFLERFTDAWWAIEGREMPVGFEKQLLLSIQSEEEDHGR